MYSPGKIIARSLLALALLPMASYGADYLCPYSLDLAMRQGWPLLELDSKMLQEKPHLRNVPRDTRVTLTRNLDPELSINFPEDAAVTVDQLDGGALYLWDVVTSSAENPVYVTCIYAGSARYYTRKPLPEGTASCNTQRQADGKYSRLLRCQGL